MNAKLYSPNIYEGLKSRKIAFHNKTLHHTTPFELAGTPDLVLRVIA